MKLRAEHPTTLLHGRQPLVTLMLLATLLPLHLLRQAIHFCRLMGYYGFPAYDGWRYKRHLCHKPCCSSFLFSFLYFRSGTLHCTVYELYQPSILITLCTTFGTTGTAGTVIFKVKGATGTGTLTNAAAPVSSALWTITNTGGTTDSTTIADVVIANDAVAVTAAVAQTLTFTVGTGTVFGTTNSGVALGTISTTKYSDDSSTNSIWLGLGTNGTGGAAVTVVSANNGALKSISVPADTIPWTGGTFATPTTNTNYGDCVVTPTATTGTLSKGTPFTSATCAHPGVGTNQPVQLTNAPQTIITSSTPLSGGQAEVMVGATIYSATPTHSDYADTQTFIATGTF